MLAKLTSKNQITIPKAALESSQKSEYYEVSIEDGRIILTPAQIRGGNAVRQKLARLGISEDDVADAVRWARKPARKTK